MTLEYRKRIERALAETYALLEKLARPTSREPQLIPVYTAHARKLEGMLADRSTANEG